MNFVPFISSGASSRLHYVLVRKVESAPSPQAADEIILGEIDSIVHKLSDINLSLAKCKEYLIILMYCITTSTVSLPDHVLDSVLTHAVNLAEAGSTIPEKRLGYLFCAEIMPPHHELRLMLVNTLRKDLESPYLTNICLALDNLIRCPSEDVIPAIHSRLQDLLAHNSLQIRRRALLAFNALSAYESDILKGIRKVIIRRIKDPEPLVWNAALVAACRLHELSEPARPAIQEAVSELLRSMWSKHYDHKIRNSLIRLLAKVRTMGAGALEPNLSLILEIIKYSSRRKDDVLLRSAYLCLPAPINQPTIFAAGMVSPISQIRALLTSREPNQQYLFLTCLESIDTKFWAGTTPEIPMALKQWEVEQIMRFLDSPDFVLRKKTMHVLNNVDANIVSSYYAGALQNLPNVPLEAKSIQGCWLLQVLEVQSSNDGERYAQDVKALLDQVDVDAAEGQIWEDVVDIVLSHIRQAPSEFRLECAAFFLHSLSELNVRLGPTLTIITAALACELSSEASSTELPAPLQLLEGLCSRLALCSAPVQDACLLAMLCIAADCADIPSHIPTAVSKLREVSGRYIKRRCDQFIQCSSDKETLGRIVSNARSRSLPDFLEALQSYNAGDSSRRLYSAESSPRGSYASVANSLSVSKLRYAAYDAPVPTPRLRGTKLSNSNVSAGPSMHGSPLGSSRSPDSLDAGDLALAASTPEFESEMSFAAAKPSPLIVGSESSNAMTRNDLIALDSPFISDPAASQGPEPEPMGASEMDFENAWNGLQQEARGWHGESIDQLLRRVQIMDPTNVRVRVVEASLPPFQGDLKVMIKSDTSHALLRLKESEEESEESCLWRLRGISPMYTTVKKILSED